MKRSIGIASVFMKRLDLARTLVWIALGALAVLYLNWRNREVDQEARQPIPLLFDSLANPARLDSLPKPFAKLRAPSLLAPRRTTPPSRPLKLRADPGQPVTVSITAYCLTGRTRSGTPVRDGIVAADPRVFPLNSEIDLIVGRDTLGRFRVEDTGLLIKGRKIDLWLANCGDARGFGRKQGSATLVPKIRR